jgi:CrcB protein
MGEGTVARILVLSLGGVLGVNARYWLGEWITTRLGPRFPWATLGVNVTGAFLIGAMAVFLARWLPHSPARLLVITGFLGGYTTFSSYTLEAFNLWEGGRPGHALSYLLGSLVAGMMAVVLGVVVARGMTTTVERWFSPPRPPMTQASGPPVGVDHRSSGTHDEIEGRPQGSLSGSSQTP